MQITRVGFGAWAIGGPAGAVGWGPQDDRGSIAAIRRAAELGVNWIDTAAVYGFGHSEEVICEALREIPAERRPYVFTKCGRLWDQVDRSGGVPRGVGAPASIRAEAEASLERLGVERLDLLQMHRPPQDGTPLADYWGTLLELKKEGKARAIGLSNHSVAQVAEAEVIGHVDSLQPPFSAIRRQAAASELPWCAARETGVIVYSPMQSGLLSGRFTAERAAALPEDDWRTRNDEFSGEKLRRNLALAEAIKPIAVRRGTSAASVAIAWTLAWPEVTGAIAGARSPAQVEGWIDAARLELSQGDLDEMVSAIGCTGAGAGPTRP
jgi:aryl-alcohol dehydrogenase-like predicted oxidoreductase